jgi:prevent-host-death family protein
MALIDTKHMISMADASKRGISALIRDAESGEDQIVLRNNRAVAAVISIERLDRLQQLEDDLADITLAAARLLTASAERSTLDDVLAEFGYTREELDDSK